MTCRECAQHEEVSMDLAFEWVRRSVIWWEPDWWTERRIDRALERRQRMNKAYAAGLCRGQGHEEPWEWTYRTEEGER